MADGKPSRPKSAPKKRASKAGSARKRTSKKSEGKVRPAEIIRPVTELAGLVGVGASAGGLEALQGLASKLPVDSGLAFVIIQHLPAGHKSIMASLLAKYTSLPVMEISDGLEIKPNRIYLHPADSELNVLKGGFYLTPVDDPHAPRLPIDHFLRSLAEDMEERAVCIILSGTGSDGTFGLKAVKGAGGLVMVQKEEQAQYPGMPHSAISTGLVDFVLPVEKMGEKLKKYIRHPLIVGRKDEPSPSKRLETYIQKILIEIRGRTGKDFSGYKQNTVRRRVERRMAVHQIDDTAAYLRYIKEHPGEVESLAQDMLIGVTSFFRDPEAYDVLKKVLEQLLKAKGPDGVVRVWVPGCSTGEEAYSIAMVLQEIIDKNRKSANVSVFATDIDAGAVAFARAARYPDSVVADVTPVRLRKFFTRSDNVYTVSKRIRDMIIFAEQNLIKDPPFSHLDLVSCRNLLIYFNADLQKKVLPMFHYVLNPGGFLFLGTSESVGEFVGQFTTVDLKWKVFKRKAALSHGFVGHHVPPYVKEADADRRNTLAEGAVGEREIRSLAEGAMLSAYAPPCVLVNERYEIVYFHGNTRPYLSPPVGKATFDILQMAHEELRMKLGPILHQSRKNKRAVTEAMTFHDRDKPRSLKLLARPLDGPEGTPDLTMVIFEEEEEPGGVVAKKPPRAPAGTEKGRIAVLENEMQAMREYLQTTIEELETSNEELKSTNEELQSTNEEFQSTNEELGTSKEELQSTNEELETVNAELQGKVSELSGVNNDLANILASTEIAALFLDKNFAITRFTPAVAKIFNLIESDIGRPISDITSSVKALDLSSVGDRVLDTLIPEEQTITSADGRVFRMRAMPYRTLEDVIDGVVYTFVDVTDAQDLEAVRRLAAIVRDSNDAVTVQDLDGTITAWNRGAEKTYGYTEAEAVGMNVADLVPKGEKRQALAMVKRLLKGDTIEPLETKRVTRDGRTIPVLLTATRLTDDEGTVIAVATTERDLSSESR